MERRHYQRCPGHLYLRLVCRDGDCIQAVAREVSEGGLFVEGPVPPELEPGTPVRVQVQGILSDQSPWVEMNVIRVTGQGLALVFPEVSA
ncbi:PilZ domain-containing protein [Hahella sp. SMD15-11]|uniref:PilZ domain-containing protein n=1 Tax=Thermohahella caldifontis TaxID=3142973 RepID=A0AB39UX34_9GAMM